MQPNPFYKDEKERNALSARIASFSFSEADKMPKTVVLVAGKEGSGKTHLACTMNALGPVYLIDTEYRAQIVTQKFPNVKFTVARCYADLVVAVKHITKHEAPGTIVLDSGSDLQTFSEIEYLERSEKEKVGMPWNWAEVWRLCNAIIDEVKFSRSFNLVVTARLKEEYANDKGTGKFVPRVYSVLPYKADIMLQFTGTKMLVTKNGFKEQRPIPVEVDSKATLPDIINQLSGQTVTPSKVVVPSGISSPTIMKNNHDAQLLTTLRA